MVKRARSVEHDAGYYAAQAVKRRRASTDNSSDRLSRLSDELIIRVLSHLTASQLVNCERLSHKYHDLAADNQLWRNLYYKQFVRPRAVRIPGVKDGSITSDLFEASAASSTWLDESHLLKRKSLNWKKQFKLRQNWIQGTCAVSEIPVAEETSIPPILVQMHDGVIYSTDLKDGLRAWSVKEKKMIANLAWDKARPSPPTSIAVDSTKQDSIGITLMVGFEDGTFRLYTMHPGLQMFTLRCMHDETDGVISSVAISFPYILSMTATQKLSLYRLSDTIDKNEHDKFAAPKLLHFLKSHTVWPPLSTSLRLTPTTTTIAIAYALPTYLSGWTVGLQELHISRTTNDLLTSRTTSAITTHYRPLAYSIPPTTTHLTPFRHLHQIHAKPTSLSYTHPYLLVSHPDTTLTLYLVTSTADSLSISPGSRLWGHTSAISGAHIGGRGKAVSISQMGDELRVWELEGGFASSAARRRLGGGGLSVQIRPGSEVRILGGRRDGGGRGSCSVEAREDVIDGEDGEREPDMMYNRGWVGFDEENVVVLRERARGEQALVVYDFT